MLSFRGTDIFIQFYKMYKTFDINWIEVGLVWLEFAPRIVLACDVSRNGIVTPWLRDSVTPSLHIILRETLTETFTNVVSNFWFMRHRLHSNFEVVNMDGISVNTRYLNNYYLMVKKKWRLAMAFTCNLYGGHFVVCF